MPFVTEELWQRLPNRTKLAPVDKQVKTIMLASYPTPVEDWFRPDVEACVTLVKDAIHGARSLRSDYNVANHVKADFYFKTDSLSVRSAILEQADDFCTLARGNLLKYVATPAEDITGIESQVVMVSTIMFH